MIVEDIYYSLSPQERIQQEEAIRSNLAELAHDLGLIPVVEPSKVFNEFQYIVEHKIPRHHRSGEKK